jgi:uncharacterized protein YqfA (UPF0365 family)
MSQAHMLTNPPGILLNAMAAPTIVPLVLLLIVLAICLFSIIQTARFISLIIRARVSGVYIAPINLLGMKLRKIDAKMIVMCLIQSQQAGLPISCPEMERHFLAGGNVQRVVAAMIAAKNAGLELSWKQACEIDLTGDDVLQYVRESMRSRDVTAASPPGTPQ